MTLVLNLLLLIIILNILSFIKAELKQWFDNLLFRYEVFTKADKIINHNYANEEHNGFEVAKRCTLWRMFLYNDFIITSSSFLLLFDVFS